MVGEVLAFICFFLTQAMLSGRHRGVSLAQPGVPGAVLAGGFVLCACALTALSLGAITRHTPGAITATLAAIYGLAALCLVLPSPWKDDFGRFTMPFAASEILAVHRVLHAGRQLGSGSAVAPGLDRKSKSQPWSAWLTWSPKSAP